MASHGGRDRAALKGIIRGRGGNIAAQKVTEKPNDSLILLPSPMALHTTDCVVLSASIQHINEERVFVNGGGAPGSGSGRLRGAAAGRNEITIGGGGPGGRLIVLGLRWIIISRGLAV